jgi:hypothetical protein
MRDDRKMDLDHGGPYGATATCHTSLVDPAGSCETCRELMCTRALDRQKRRSVVVAFARIRLGR